MMSRLLKIVFFGVAVKPIVLIVLGLNVRWREKLPDDGPAIIAANHNSHLDTMVLMSLYPLSKIHKVRPVAAADYFLKNGKALAWFSLNCLDIIPIDRSGAGNREELFEKCHQALDNSEILIIFPEGSRGNPEEISRVKKGIFYIIKDRIDTLVTPVMMHGLGRSLPRGDALFVPFNCDVVIGDEIAGTEKSTPFIKAITDAYIYLRQYCLPRNGR